ncbi:hypothetical protein [Photobacterium profundum]|uniref:hypothetical protein n=1 Tax=Photobacterium profundum TaxID=74109 RepID=UPI003D12A768
MKDKVPRDYSIFINEPAFSMDMGSCIWFLNNDCWQKLGNSVSDLPNPETIHKMKAKDFCDFVDEIYEQEINCNLVAKIFDSKFEIEMASKINPNVDLTCLKEELLEIGLST